MAWCRSPPAAQAASESTTTLLRESAVASISCLAGLSAPTAATNNPGCKCSANSRGDSAVVQVTQMSLAATAAARFVDASRCHPSWMDRRAANAVALAESTSTANPARSGRTAAIAHNCASPCSPQPTMVIVRESERARCSAASAATAAVRRLVSAMESMMASGRPSSPSSSMSTP
jgi:hypothetical protein